MIRVNNVYFKCIYKNNDEFTLLYLIFLISFLDMLSNLKIEFKLQNYN